ncbi:hypothetical protein K6U06_02305 [Acidiferrimicrobium sp. IK]|uniref:hypothetical protein n=1 Tax=Acidiferrimicrobium sp. IK TaxID=2871700 RepID=UPI0021CB5984|nr:hypothetical protein [Acidiferrimicrobium sp. IK]MCU4183177.1 hypothetical protein [Acidiferrimicrobium sp. IK]
MHRPSRRAVAGIAATLSVAVAGCGSSSTTSSSATTAAAPTTGSPTSAVSLKGVCPSTIVTQTDWDPEADHSELYQLALGPNGTIDTSKKTYTAEMMVKGQDTGVKIQVRVGGPAIGYNNVDAQMYTDSSILLGYVSTDAAIRDSSGQPTVALVAPRQHSPLMFMWDPSKYPQLSTVASIGQSNAKVLVESGQAYTDYLVGKGILKAGQLDTAYNSTPTQFVASGGADVQQGFATAEPYIYAHELPQWDKPLKYALISSTGYDPYAEALATLPANVTKYAACFKKLIPDIQQAQVDYAENPGPADALIVKLVSAYNNGWVYDANVAAYSAKTQVADGIIANGSDGVMGSQDASRISNLITQLTPIDTKAGKAPKAGLSASDLFTNQFIDTSIKLPAGTTGS